MRRVELQQLLPSGTISDRSRIDVLQDAASVTGAGSAGPGELGSLLEGPTKDVTEQVSTLASQIATLNSTQQTQLGATQDNTQAITQNTNSKGSGSSVGGALGTIASNLLGGLSLSPILGGLISLFGGDDSQSSAPPTLPFRLPPPVQYEAGLTGTSIGQATPVSYGAGGQARSQMSSPAQQITVHVNAMDSRSFVDHSEEIARAVREALLNSNSLGDVITDL